jgi:hypothetical protein
MRHSRSVFDNGGFFFIWVLSWLGLIGLVTILAGAGLKILSYLFSFGWNLI